MIRNGNPNLASQCPSAHGRVVTQPLQRETNFAESFWPPEIVCDGDTQNEFGVVVPRVLCKKEGCNAIFQVLHLLLMQADAICSSLGKWSGGGARMHCIDRGPGFGVAFKMRFYRGLL